MRIEYLQGEFRGAVVIQIELERLIGQHRLVRGLLPGSSLIFPCQS
jgi:hypothetical protein